MGREQCRLAIDRGQHVGASVRSSVRRIRRHCAGDHAVRTETAILAKLGTTGDSPASSVIHCEVYYQCERTNLLGSGLVYANYLTKRIVTVD